MNIAQILLINQPAILVGLINAGLLDEYDLLEILTQRASTKALMSHDSYRRERGAIVQRGFAS